MDKEIFEGLVTSIKQAVAISKGEMEPSRVFHIDPIDVKAIREKAGLSVPEFVKKILLEHFENEERGEKERSVLYEIREEYQEMAQRLEKTVSQSIRRHDVVLLEAINKMGGINLLKTDILTEGQMDARLPEISGKVLEGALDFLNQ